MTKESRDWESARAELFRLARRIPLGEEWALEKPFFEEANVDGLAIQLVGLTASLGSTSVTGAAASHAELPVSRAYFELVERSGTLQASLRPKAHYALLDTRERQVGEVSAEDVFPPSARSGQWTYSRSNGVALHGSFREAAEAAWLELIERDRVLRCWFGETVAQQVSLPSFDWRPLLERSFDVVGFIFPEAAAEEAPQVAVVAGIFAFPRSRAFPLVHGMGAGRSQSVALFNAGREMVQSLGFLWGEALPEEPPEPAPTPDFHQDHYLCPAMHERLREWLSGEHAGRGSALSDTDEPKMWAKAAGLQPVFVDISPAGWTESVRLVKALPTRELPLTFGYGHPHLSSARPELSVHPIT